MFPNQLKRILFNIFTLPPIAQRIQGWDLRQSSSNQGDLIRATLFPHLETIVKALGKRLDNSVVSTWNLL
jgi:hypothetical protein